MTSPPESKDQERIAQLEAQVQAFGALAKEWEERSEEYAARANEAYRRGRQDEWELYGAKAEAAETYAEELKAFLAKGSAP